MSLEGFEASQVEIDGVTRTVYRRGAGPGVVVIHEIPGITPQVAAFARRLAGEGFTVFLPELFGTAGKALSAPYVAEQLLRVCIAQEFSTLALGQPSPITDWLRGLARRVHEELGGPGVGALGMCLTGGFALTLFLEPAVLAPVLSQPSCPFPLTPARCRALDASDEAVANAKRRIRDEGRRVLGLRFSADAMSPAARFETLKREFGEGFEAVEIDSGFGNAHGLSPLAHSVLTTDFVDREGHPTRAAYDRVVALFREQLEVDA